MVIDTKSFFSLQHHDEDEQPMINKIHDEDDDHDDINIDHHYDRSFDIFNV